MPCSHEEVELIFQRPGKLLAFTAVSRTWQADFLSSKDLRRVRLQFKAQPGIPSVLH
jgi:hypothetical protein